MDEERSLFVAPGRLDGLAAVGRRPLPSGPSPHRRLRDAALVGVALVAGLASLGAYTTYRIWDVGHHDDRHRADAIVVLGAAQYNGLPSRVLAARLDHAIELYREGYAPFLIVTGGKLPADVTTEAATERAYAMARGVPASAILAETTGRTTLESLEHVRGLLAERGLSSAVFVSDRTHMLRVLRIAADQGIEGWGSPTATSPSDTSSGLLFESVAHELGALALYFVVEQPRTVPPRLAQPVHAGADHDPFPRPTEASLSGQPGEAGRAGGSPSLAPLSSHRNPVARAGRGLSRSITVRRARAGNAG